MDCPFCSRPQPSSDAWLEHMGAEHEEAYICCPFCDISEEALIYNGPDLYIHVLENHSRDLHGRASSIYPCDRCDFIAIDVGMLENHFLTNHCTMAPSVPSTAHIRAAAQGTSSGTDCPVCGALVLNGDALQRHVNAHFDPPVPGAGAQAMDEDAAIAAQLQADESCAGPSAATGSRDDELLALQVQYGMDESGSYREQRLAALDKQLKEGKITQYRYQIARQELAVQHNRGTETTGASVKGLISKIRYLSEQSPDVAECIVCSSRTEHFPTSPADSGWGCGYRNAQMLISALLKEEKYEHVISEHFFNGEMPSVPKIQGLVERAWAEGFDVQGRDQLNGKLKDTKKWIGTTEVGALLMLCGVRVRSYDFIKPTGPGNTHPRLFELVWRLFSEHKQGFVPPMYIQHQGHSRTIIGIEKLKNSDREDVQYRLLLFDPSQWKNRLRAFLNSKSDDSCDLKMFRKSLSDLKEKQYQVLIVCGLIETEDEKNDRPIPGVKVGATLRSAKSFGCCLD